MKNIILLISILGLLGCSATGPKFENFSVNPNKGLIYIYIPERDSNIHGRIPPTVYLNDKEIGLLKFNGHFAFNVNPGKQKIGTQVMGGGNMASINVNISRGETKYIFYTTSFTGGGLRMNHGTTKYVKSRLLEETEEMALPKISKTKLISKF